jgi:hypothetical protein
VQHWLEKYGFAFLVFVALACTSYIAGSAQVPHPVPDLALQSREIYRLEIAVAFFVAFYLATLTVLLALDGKGFAEFGTRGLKATTVIGPTAREQRETLSQQLKLADEAEREVEELVADLEDLQGRVNLQQVRLDELASKR